MNLDEIERLAREEVADEHTASNQRAWRGSVRAHHLARAILAMLPVVRTSVALREADSSIVPGESIADLNAKAPEFMERTARALVRWRNAVYAFRTEAGKRE